MQTNPSSNATRRRIAIIGYGAITHELLAALDLHGALNSVVAVLVRPSRMTVLASKAAGRFQLVSDLEGLLQRRPEIVVEAAGHEAVEQFGANIIGSGVDLMVASTGALADTALAERLARVARAELWIASGAVAGLDGLLAARTAGLNSVRFTSLKPPVAWRGTPAEKYMDESVSQRRIVFFEGTAREAAALYPQNANVAATIALASLGLDRTQVHLGSDPRIEGPVGIIDAAGAFGTFHFEMLGRASATNPKTSAITGHSLACALIYGMCFRALDPLRAEVLRSR